MTEAVQAKLASVYDSALTERSLRKRKRGCTSCRSIDEALNGGFDYGQLSCISGDKSTGKTAVCPKLKRIFAKQSTASTNVFKIYLNALAHHLFSAPDAQAAVIDTTGSFDVLKLHKVLLELGVKFSLPNSEVRSEQALDRVRVMRVFDFVGVAECINEIRDENNKSKQAGRPPSSPAPAEVTKRIEVADSEDEDDEMLLELPVVSKKVQSQPASPQPAVENATGTLSWMIVVDNFCTVASPLMRSNYVQGQALLSNFLRSLAQLTKIHEIAAILINNVVSNKSSVFSMHRLQSTAPESTPWIDTGAGGLAAADCPSIFASNMDRPALGKTFGSLLDLHVMTSMLPETRADAQILYGDEGAAGLVRTNAGNVLEVLSDRYDSRVGRWNPFKVELGIILHDRK